MAADANCPDCGAPIPEGQPKGLCSRCALKGALELSATADALTPPLPHAASGHPLPSDGRRAGGEGKVFGDYELLEEIARGGMGIVFKARQRKLDRIVAVKMILAGEFASKEQALRFRVEAEAAARLQHPNIVRIHETGEQDGQPYFSMDYVEGGNLAALVREKPLPAKRAAGYVKTIAEAIHYAHEQGILHRDLKPSNVLIDHADQPRVTDFGLAKRMTKESFLTVTGDVMGSPSFMPPEQAGYRSSRREEAQTEKSENRKPKLEGEQSLVTSAAMKVRAGRYSDVYGLGAILFYLVTGRPPFVAENVAETLHHVLNSEPVSPRLLNPSVPQDLATICLKCLEKEPAKRYQTAQQLADEFGRFLNGEPIHARPVSRVEKAWRWCRRRPTAAAAMATVLAAVGLAGLFAQQARQAEYLRACERKQNALEKALMVAWSGDFAATELAIQEAEVADVSPGVVRMLRGSVAMHRGDYREAVEQLEQAWRLSSNSVAVCAMLMTAYASMGAWEKAQPLFAALDRMEPRTPEDFLARGALEASLEPSKALKTLNEAVRRRPTGIARLYRGGVLASLAADSDRIEDAEAAMADASAAKVLAPENPAVRTLSLNVHLIATGIFAEARLQGRHSNAWRQAQADARALEQFPENQAALITRAMYLKLLGEDWTPIEKLRAGLGNNRNSMLDYLAAVSLYRRGACAEALAGLAPASETASSGGDYVRGYLLAELPNGPALSYAEVQRLRQKPLSTWDAAAIQTTLRLLGRRPEAIEMSRMARQLASPISFWRKEWNHRLLDFNCGDLSEAELLRSAGNSKFNLCEAHFFIGMDRLSQADRAGARDHFRLCVATRVFNYLDYDWSSSFLARLEKDPNWPPWIPGKPESSK